MSTAVGILVVIALVAATGFFVAVEFAMVASDREKLHTDVEAGRRSARAALGVMKNMSFHLSGAQLGITVCSLALGFVAKPVIATLIDPLVVAVIGREEPGVSVFLALALSTIVLLVVGELIPKNVAVARAEPVLYALTPAIRIVDGLFKPIIVSFNGVANLLVRMLGVEPMDEPEEISSIIEIEYLIRSSAESGSLDSDALSLLTRTLRFGDKIAADALAPRVKVEALPVTASVADLIERSGTTGHSRYPIFGDDLDDIVGVADIADVFNLSLSERSAVGVDKIMAEPTVVPETKDLVDILADFKDDNQMLVVLDEHGGTAGILTLEDVLEEIVGEIDDEYDLAETPILADLASGMFILEGTLHEDEVAEASGFIVPQGEDYETLAGFVLQQLGKIPEAGDSIEVDGWHIEVVEMDGLRVATLQLTMPAAFDRGEAS